MEQIAKANAAGIEAIRSLVVHVTQYGEVAVPGDLAPARTKRAEFTWYWSGGEQRVQQRIAIHNPTPAKDKPQGGKPRNEAFSDQYNGSKGFKELRGYDPNDPPSLSESELGGCNGSYGIRSPDKTAFGIFPGQSLLWAVLEKRAFHSLTELVRSSKSIRIAKRPSESALRCYELEVVRAAAEFTIYVDPAANFMIRRVDTRYAIASPVTQAKLRMFQEVKEFRDFGNGVFLPVGLHGEMTETETAKTRVEVEVKSVNEPLPPETFEVKFLDWMRVTDSKTGQIHIWGPDDKPRRTFESPGKYHEWYRPILMRKLAAESESQSQRRWLMIVAAAFVLWGGGGAWHVWRKRRRAAGSLKS